MNPFSKRILFIRLFLILCLFYLTACAHLQTPSIPNSTNQLYQGRFSLQYTDQYQHKKNLYGNFTLIETPHRTELALQTPLQQTIALIEQNEIDARLTLPNQPVKVAANLTELMEDTLGFSLPISNLTYWLNITASPNSPAKIHYDADNPKKMDYIEQDGWHIQYIAYTDQQRVKLIEMTRAQPNLSIRLVFND